MNKRKSYIGLGDIVFWTATINNWNPLLEKDENKNVIINSLDYLSNAGKIEVFAFVIMPTHIHFIWRIIELNGKETPQGSFLKYTAHKFKKLLKQDDTALQAYKVTATNKRYEFWQRDPLAISILSKEMAMQKLNYIHNNPVSGKWDLAKEPNDYKYSSSTFYDSNKMDFLFLKNLFEEF